MVRRIRTVDRKRRKVIQSAAILAAAMMGLAGCAAGSSALGDNTAEETAGNVAEGTDTSSEETESSSGETDASDAAVRIGSLKGPTSMGLVNLMADSDAGVSENQYEFHMVTQADEIVAMMVQGKLDIALVPANVASVLYNRTEGNISVIDVNTLGVLYIVECGDSIHEISDLKGKTVYLTGKGTTPDYCIQYLLSENGLSLDDVNLEYKSEATEVAVLLSENDEAIGLLPQPFVTTALMSNDKLHIALNLSDEWDKCADSSMVTGVTIVRNEFLSENSQALSVFLEEHAKSVLEGENDLDTTCERIEQYGIIKSAVAKQAYSYCNIVCLTGEDMKKALEGYLEVLYSFNAETVGGELPKDDFYVIGLK